MELYPCIWMRADTKGNIWCCRPKVVGGENRLDVPCDTNFLHPEECEYYVSDKGNPIRSDGTVKIELEQDKHSRPTWRILIMVGIGILGILFGYFSMDLLGWVIGG